MSYLISKCLFLFMRPNNSFPLDFRLHHIIYHSNSNAIIEDWQCIRAMSCFTARFEFGIKHAWTYASIECCIEVLVGVYSKRATKQDIFKYRACLNSIKLKHPIPEIWSIYWHEYEMELGHFLTFVCYKASTILMVITDGSSKLGHWLSVKSCCFNLYFSYILVFN